MTADYDTDQASGNDWTMNLGDSCERLGELADDSVDLSVFSPPFAGLYSYSPSPRDLGNCSNTTEFLTHYRFIVDELLRITKPGRNCCVHVADVATTKATHGVSGLYDLSGDVIRAHVAAGWTFYGRWWVDLDPQCLRDGTPVLTPTGWQPIEELAVGDQVIGSDGHPTKVTDVPYSGVQPLYRVRFDDGTEIECGPEHSWTVRTSPDNAWVTYRTDELHRRGVRTASGRLRYKVPIVPAVQYAPGPDLPIPPRLLGALLADGNWAAKRGGVHITKDRELVEALPLPPGHRVVYRPGSDRASGRTATYGITCDRPRVNGLLDDLRALGLGTCRAWEKFIPRAYLFASEEDRRELLRGLLDGDGKIIENGAIYYRTTSAELAANVVELVNSIGGLAIPHCREGGRYGDNQQGRPLWEISVGLDGDWCPFTLARKAERWKSGRNAVRRSITDITMTGESAPCTCITVAADDGLFVTEGHVVTHNSVAQRTKAQHLMFVTKNRDSARTAPATGDQMLLFRKPGDNAVPIPHTADESPPGVSNQDWIAWARPVWLGINRTRTLNVASAKEADDTRHLHALQLDFIERCVRLWSNPGELVVSPFAGVGSEVFTARKLGRRGWGCELKKSYFETAVQNLRKLDDEIGMPSLFDEVVAS